MPLSGVIPVALCLMTPPQFLISRIPASFYRAQEVLIRGIRCRSDHLMDA
jgi:hypothetical protein